MGELPRYINDRIGLDVSEKELLIESICKTSDSFKDAERFINRMVVDFEYNSSVRGLSDCERESYYDWLDVLSYFEMHKVSFRRQYFGYGSI